MKIRKKWAMPNGNTFNIRPIGELISDVMMSFRDPIVCDPFVNESPFFDLCSYTNDIDPSIPAGSNIDAYDFLVSIPDNDCDIVLFDPPYSPRQVSECYKKFGLTVNMQTTQSSYWTKLKVEISRITKVGGAVITCGWNSGGIGKKYGFEQQEILLVAHGGWHNDTIVTVERKVK